MRAHERGDENLVPIVAAKVLAKGLAKVAEHAGPMNPSRGGLCTRPKLSTGSILSLDRSDLPPSNVHGLLRRSPSLRPKATTIVNAGAVVSGGLPASSDCGVMRVPNPLGTVSHGLMAVGLSTALLLAGCTGGSGTGAVPSPTATALPSPVFSLPSPTPSLESGAAALAQYEKFWTVLPQASRLAQGAPRDALLAQYLTGAALASTTRAMEVQDAAGKRLYGYDVPRAEVVDLGAGTVTIRDCQDSSHSGIEEVDSGKPFTVGVQRNPVRSRMEIGTDGRWRLATIEFLATPC